MTSFGDPTEAFSAYVVPEIDMLYRVARSLTPQAADAEDLLQDTLLRAFLAIDRFDGNYPKAWLLTILRNVAHNRHRRRPVQFLDDQALDVRNDQWPNSSAEQLVIDQTFEADLSRAFQSLSDKHRQIVLLVDLHGLSYIDAAEALEIPVGTLTSRLHRARNHIRGRLQHANLYAR